MLKMEPRKIMKSGNLMSPALFTMVQMLLPRMQRLRARKLLHQFTGLITSYNMMYLSLELEDMCLSLVCDLRQSQTEALTWDNHKYAFELFQLLR
jgi:hypothetical protein